MIQRLSLFLLLIVIPASATAATENAKLCETAARSAEHEYLLPDGLLQAIARVETNRGSAEETEAWPWTVNVNGEGRWFETRSEAEKFVRETQIVGVKSIDIGCFQINSKWHGDEFDNTDAMFDPKRSAEYAASFLTALKAEKGNWKSAVEAYHSRLPEKAERYSSKVTKALDEMGGENQVHYFTAASLQRLGGVDRGARSSLGGVSLSAFPPLAPLFGASLSSPIINVTGPAPLFEDRGDDAD